MSKAIVVTGLAFGDEGKGSVVDALARRWNSKLVVRFNGGAQAAHNVVTPEGQHHTFAQLGSGSFAGAATFLSRYVAVNPHSFANETTAFRKNTGFRGFPPVYVDERALVTTPYHVAANKIRELARGDGRHGSCGMGVGETVDFSINHPDLALRVGDLRSEQETRRKLLLIREHLRCAFPALHEMEKPGVDMHRVRGQYAVLSGMKDGASSGWPSVESLDFAMYRYRQFVENTEIVDPEWLTRYFSDHWKETVIFEGAQGVLLDEGYGFHPHTTWSCCTFDNADTLLNGARAYGNVTHLGVLRTFMTRHGAGPFPSETFGHGGEDLGFMNLVQSDHNTQGDWQGHFRVGRLDFMLLKYALTCAGRVDGLVVTHCDKELPSKLAVDGYRYDGKFSSTEDPLTLLVGDRKIPRLERQEALAQRLMKRPEKTYIEMLSTPDDPRRLPEFIAEQLHTPLAGMSFGPTATDKVWTAAW